MQCLVTWWKPGLLAHYMQLTLVVVTVSIAQARSVGDTCDHFRKARMQTSQEFVPQASWAMLPMAPTPVGGSNRKGITGIPGIFRKCLLYRGFAEIPPKKWDSVERDSIPNRFWRFREQTRTEASRCERCEQRERRQAEASGGEQR